MRVASAVQAVDGAGIEQPAVRMIGRRRRRHLPAIVDDSAAALRAIPGNGCWRFSHKQFLIGSCLDQDQRKI
jgi:hypothetical protein